MKKILTVSLCLLLSGTHALANGLTKFTTLAEAEQHCPSNMALTFMPYNPKYSSEGIIEGSFNNVLFKTSTPEPEPYLDANNFIQGAIFFNNGGSYGYSFGSLTVCFYRYIDTYNQFSFISLENRTA